MDNNFDLDENKRNGFGTPENNGQGCGGYPDTPKKGEFRINAAISPKTFNKIIIAIVAGSAAVSVFAVIKLIGFISRLF